LQTTPFQKCRLGIINGAWQEREGKKYQSQFAEPFSNCPSAISAASSARSSAGNISDVFARYEKACGDSACYMARSWNMKVSAIRLDLYAIYYLNKPAAFRPFIKGGPAVGLSPSYTAVATKDEYYAGASHVTTTDPFAEPGFKKIQFGFTLGAGLRHQRFGLEYQYESTRGHVHTMAVRSSLAVNSVFLSYRLLK